MHSLFEDSAKRLGDRAIAVEDDGAHNDGKSVKLTYKQFDQRAEDIAAALEKLGVGAGSMVAVMTHRCVGMIASLFGECRLPMLRSDGLFWQASRRQGQPL